MRRITLLTILLWSATSCQSSTGGQFADAKDESPAPAADAGTRDAGDVLPAVSPAVSGRPEDVTFDENAFPPTLPDTAWHREGWNRNDCLRCHETGVQKAPRVLHEAMPAVLLTAKCRTCHVLIPGSEPRGAKQFQQDTRFAANAFPPMLPRSSYHGDSWHRADCLLCHESGIKGAPIVRHEGLPGLLLSAKCRTCHVQVRAAGE